MQKKLDELESSKKFENSKISSNIQTQINEMKHQMRKFEYENLSLREEREDLIVKIQQLEQSNLNQEKMINQLQFSII